MIKGGFRWRFIFYGSVRLAVCCLHSKWRLLAVLVVYGRQCLLAGPCHFQWNRTVGGFCCQDNRRVQTSWTVAITTAATVARQRRNRRAHMPSTPSPPSPPSPLSPPSLGRHHRLPSVGGSFIRVVVYNRRRLAVRCLPWYIRTKRWLAGHSSTRCHIAFSTE